MVYNIFFSLRGKRSDFYIFFFFLSNLPISRLNINSSLVDDDLSILITNSIILTMERDDVLTDFVNRRPVNDIISGPHDYTYSINGRGGYVE